MRKIRTGAVRIVSLAIVLGLSQLVQAQQASGPMWTQLSPAQNTNGGSPAPAKRLLQSTAYDPATNSMIAFGGATQDFGNFGVYNDTWVLTHADGTGGTSAWIQLLPPGAAPAARFGAGGVYDSASNRLIIFGGATFDYTGTCAPTDNTGFVNDVWILTNANGLGGTPAWTQVTPAGTPPAPRRSGAVVYDSANNRLILFGGNEACGISNDVWVLTNANGLGADTPTWTQLTPSGLQPAARGEIGSAGVYDAGDNMLLIFGGRGASADFNDLWVLSNANGLGGAPVWTQQSPVAGPPPARHAHTVTYDSVDNALMVIGGVDFTETQFLGDVWWLWNANGLATTTQNWAQLTFSSASPLPRAGHGAVYHHQTDRRATIFAGATCAPCAGLTDAWVFSGFDVVLFDPLSASVHINENSRSFNVKGHFSLASGRSIDPMTQPVGFQLGGFATTIPAGSFTQKNGGSYTFTGTINGVPLDVTIQPHQGGYDLWFDGAGASNLPTANPVTVTLTIGPNTGSVKVNAYFN
ncbi:MAG: hypothetical protein E6H00_09735 [Bacillati bacterium ANGP1]|uniref:Galactose oxidase n=1 Tax=Candidatus Segetimicrobium genomatis TaxID=2569760 RepID=A0A537K147_9BACT|nr:MAG: hypothetical protein E6H00_09735 [Terrabacteria group bacterium ANGP1]